MLRINRWWDIVLFSLFLLLPVNGMKAGDGPFTLLENRNKVLGINLLKERDVLDIINTAYIKTFAWRGRDVFLDDFLYIMAPVWKEKEENCLRAVISDNLTVQERYSVAIPIHLAGIIPNFKCVIDSSKNVIDLDEENYKEYQGLFNINMVRGTFPSLLIYTLTNHSHYIEVALSAVGISEESVDAVNKILNWLGAPIINRTDRNKLKATNMSEQAQAFITIINNLSPKDCYIINKMYMTLFQLQDVTTKDAAKNFIIKINENDGIVIPSCLAQKYLNCSENPFSVKDDKFHAILPAIITCLLTNNNKELERLRDACCNSVEQQEWVNFVETLKKPQEQILEKTENRFSFVGITKFFGTPKVQLVTIFIIGLFAFLMMKYPSKR